MVAAEMGGVAVKHIVSFSGGKDSTAMLLRMLEEGWPVDEIVHVHTGMEFGQMYRHIGQVREYIGRPITVLRPKHSFLYYMFRYEKKKGQNKGQKGYGWPHVGNGMFRWCTRHIKQEVLMAHMRPMEPLYNYRGIAADEPGRMYETAYGRPQQKIRYPLAEWGMKESDALGLCYSRGFDWGGLYQHFDRVSCFLCPMQGIGELRKLYNHYPLYWSMLRYVDSRARGDIRPDWTVAELEARFAEEAQQQTLGVTP